MCSKQNTKTLCCSHIIYSPCNTVFQKECKHHSANLIHLTVAVGSSPCPPFCRPCCLHWHVSLSLPFFFFCLSFLWPLPPFIFIFIFIYLFPPMLNFRKTPSFWRSLLNKDEISLLNPLSVFTFPLIFLLYISIYIYRPIGKMVKVFINGQGDWALILDQVILKNEKMVHNASLLNTQHYNGSRVHGAI